MENIILGNGFHYEGKAGSELLDATVVESLDQTDVMPKYTMYKALLSFVNTPIINPDQKYGARYANGGLARKEERGNKKERGINFGPKKGIYQHVFSEKFNISEDLTEWIRSSNTIKGAPEGVQAEYIEIQEQVADLVDGYDITMADILVRVYTKGFVMTEPEGPGSPTAKGQPLFSATHQVLNGDGTVGTFDNLLPAGTIDYTNVASGVAALQEMLNRLKKSNLDNGRKMEQAGARGYDLHCSRLQETYWKRVLNNGSQTSAVGAHEGIINQFVFDNNMVNLKVIDTLGDYDSVTGEIIGNEQMVFLCNPVYIEKQKCFRCYELYSPKIKTWMNDDTDEIFTSLKCSIGADHYYAEYGVIGYAGI